ncbi:MAG: permease-like cell division protein FtsX [Myxococcales bacterium]|nr:permease-like cell division protein FtsX [Myxococcales bacterium]
MEFWTALARAKRGFRDDLRLHLVAIASLVIAFLCLGAALLSVENLSRVADRWSRAQHMTVYLSADAKKGDVAQLQLVLESLAEVAQVRHVSAADAKREFVEQSDISVEASTLPDEAFPASLEVSLKSEAKSERMRTIVERVRGFGAVEEVETYEELFAQLGSLLSTGKSAVAMLAALVLICVLAIIGNTIRLAVANRRSEIEVLKLCGATDSFVRSPFVLEGLIQATAAAILALLLLVIAYFSARGAVEATLGTITGVHTVFLSPGIALAMVLGGAAAGAAGSALSLRRYLAI